MQEQLYGIAIYKEAVLLTDYKGNAPKTFIVKQEDLMDLFRFDKRVTMTPFPGLVKMTASLDGHDSYLVSIPRKKRKLIHYSNNKLTHITMEIPNMLVGASIINDRVNINHLSVYKGKLTKNTRLYEIAWPNVSGESLCLGSVHVEHEDDVIKTIEKALYDSPFNHHAQLVGKESIPFTEYIKKHKGKMPFSTLRKLPLVAESIIRRFDYE